MLYSAGIIHSKDSLIRLFVMEFKIYERRTIFFRLLLGAMIVIAAILLHLPLPIKGVMIALGAWFLSSTDFPARIRADENNRKLNGNYPKLKYEFKSSYFTVTDGKSMNIDYKKIEHLSHDNNFIYIFMGRSNAIMVNRTLIKAHIKNEGDLSFESFLENKSGRKFENTKSIISLNIFDLADIFRRKK